MLTRERLLAYKAAEDAQTDNYKAKLAELVGKAETTTSQDKRDKMQDKALELAVVISKHMGVSEFIDKIIAEV